ncbi:MAG: hypothetical protein JST91_30905 [Actinobacteria bacterium]|nr:hypothetical protein [Actinomycetota bacterium]
MTDVASTLQQLVPGGFDRESVANRIGTLDYDDSDPSKIVLTYRNRNDLTIPIGSWTLRLLPRPDLVHGGTKLVMTLSLDGGGNVTEVRMDLARFELEADPAHLIAGNLRTEPFTHIVPMPGTRKVRLLGPGLTVGLRGDDLSQPFIDASGAIGGVQPQLPSMRFDPPHFLVGSDFVGIACDEALLDLDPDVSPPGPQGTVLTPSWTGLFLKDLGVFINNDPSDDTWSFMARLQDFFVGFEGFDLSGKLTAELVHHAVDTPQLSLTGIWQQDDHSTTDLPTTPLPPPPADKPYRRVRLTVRPSWDSGGFAVDWQLPEEVVAEEPLRLDQPDVGWLRVPSGTHTVSVKVTDHRVPTQTATQVLAVNNPTTTQELAVEAVGRVVGGSGDGSDGEAHRLHLHLPRTAPLKLTVRTIGGDTSVATAKVSLFAEDFDIAAASPTIGTDTTITRGTNGAFPQVVWHVVNRTAADPDGRIGVGVELGGAGGTPVATTELRYALVDPPTGEHPDLTLEAGTDWLSEPGGGLARVALYGGLGDAQLTWTLESRETTVDAVFSSASDAFFLPTASWPEPPETVEPPLTGNVARLDLHTQNRLWRATATVVVSTAQDVFTTLVGDEGPESGRVAHEPLRSLLAGSGIVSLAMDPSPFRFAYKSAGLQADDNGVGPESAPEAASEAWVKQVAGANALLAEIAAAGPELREIHLVGAASSEGPDDDNKKLGQARADAVKALLAQVAAGNAPGWLTVPAGAAGAIAGAVITAESIGEAGAASGVSSGEPGPDGSRPASGDRIDPGDRRVVAVLRVVVQRPVPAISRTVFFLTGPGATPIAPLPVIARRVPTHPFGHAVFRSAHLEVEMLRSELTRAQVRLTLDLKKFNDSDGLAPGPGGDPPLNPADGITTFVLEYKKIVLAGATRRVWDAAVLSDPADKNGLAVTGGSTAQAIGAPLVTMPAITAISGGQIGAGGALGAVALGAAMASLGVIKASTVTWTGARARLGYGATPPVAIRIGADYTVEYTIDVDLALLGRLQTSPGRPLKVTFRNLGLTWTSPDRFDLDYDPSSGFALRVDDPGVFRLGDGIGRLLSVQNVGTGAGSPLWVEVELRLAIETGVFSIDTLKVRLSVDSAKLFERDGAGQLHLVTADWLSAVSVTISKIGMSADLPGVLSGHGQLEISGSGGTSTVAGDADLTLEPLQLRLGASFAMFTKADRRAVYLGLDAHFKPGFPLGTTGVALYGLLGLTGVNIGRTIPEPERVLDWYQHPTIGVRSVDKWTMRDGAWVFGVGATLGTAPDGGLLWNTAGALVVQTPGPQILLAADSQFLSPAPEPEQPLTAGLQTVMLLDFENGVFMAGAELVLDKQPLIHLDVPAEVFFNLRRSVDWHIHLGQWEPEDRRVRARLLGGIFDAWAYVQVEGDGFTGPMTLAGLCVAHGMRTSVRWGGGRIYLEAWVEYHLGLQMSPLYVEGLLSAGGELHLGPVSIGAEVSIQAKVGRDPDILSLHGKACGHIKIWFVKIGGCVGVDIGDGDRPTPEPKTPLATFAVIDRMTDEVLDRDSAPLDAVLHLVFDQPVYDARGADAAIDLGTPRRVQVSPTLCYEYDLTSLSISPPGAITPAAWAQPPLPDTDPAHADGARTLRLRAWEPTPFPKALDFVEGYDAQLAALLERLCDRPEEVVPGCATFDDQPLGFDTHWRLTRPVLGPVDVVAGSGGLYGVGGLPGGTSLAACAAAVVQLPEVNFAGLAATQRALRLPARVSDVGGQVPDHGGVGVTPGSAVNVTDGFLGVVPGTDDDQSVITALGSTAIRLPDLVLMQACLLVPGRLVGGSYQFFDAAMQPLGAAAPFSSATVVSSTLGADVRFSEVRRIDFDGFTAGGASSPARAVWLVLVSPQRQHADLGVDPNSYLVQVCGLTFGQWREGQRVAETRDRATTWLTQTLVTEASAAIATTAAMLAPATTYHVTGTIAWRRYRDMTTANTDGDGAFTIDETFRTAAAAPTDIRRYVAYTDPADPGQPQYRAEPVVVRFANDDIDALFAAHGQQLVTRLKADVGGESANMGATEGRFTVATASDSFERSFVDGVDGMRCVDGEAFFLFPKTEVRSSHVLAPNTGYTLSLVPRAITEPGALNPDTWDRQLELAVESGQVVYRSFLSASRWRTFTEHVAAYGSVVPGHLLADDAAAATTALATLPMLSRGDAQVDALLAVLVGGPIQLPAACEVHWLWGLAAPAADGTELPTYTLLGLVLDGPEPLLRLRPDGSASVSVTATVIPAAGGGAAPTQVLAGTTGARVLIAVGLQRVTTLELEFAYARSTGDAPVFASLTLPVPSAPGAQA